MDRNKAIEISRIYSQEVKSLYNPYKVVLYGSYSRNEQTNVQNDPSGFCEKVIRTGIEL